jgi:hypothetical protein
VQEVRHELSGVFKVVHFFERQQRGPDGCCDKLLYPVLVASDEEQRLALRMQDHKLAVEISNVLQAELLFRRIRQVVFLSGMFE